MSKPEYLVALEGLTKEISNMEYMARQANGYHNLSGNINTIPAYISSFASAHDNIDKYITNIQSTSLSDKMTVWFGWFDKSYYDLKGKKSEILKKVHVTGYTYDRHWWNYYYRRTIAENIFTIMNNVLSMTSSSLKYLIDKRYSKEEIEDEMKNFYKWLDNAIDQYLAGKGKNKLKNYIMASNLGDGYQIKMHKGMNLQDDTIQVSNILKFLESVQSTDFKAERTYNKESIKEINVKLKTILADFNGLNKQTSGADKTLGAKYIKNCISYLGILTMKLEEFYTADTESMQTVYTEMVKVLNGLYDYQGE